MFLCAHHQDEEAMHETPSTEDFQAAHIEALEARVKRMQDLLDTLTTPNVSYFDMTPAEEIARLESRVAELEAREWELSEKADSRLNRIAELEHDLSETHSVLAGAIARGGELLGERDRYREALDAMRANLCAMTQTPIIESWIGIIDSASR